MGELVRKRVLRLKSARGGSGRTGGPAQGVTTTRLATGFTGCIATDIVAGHFHKAEAARASGVAVRHNADPVHLPERFKHLPEFVF